MTAASSDGKPAPIAPRRRGTSPPWTTTGKRVHATLKLPIRLVSDHVLLDVTVSGASNVPRTGPLLLAGNHSSWLDGPLVVMNAPRLVRCLVKSELYGGKLGGFLELVGQIPVDRGKADLTALNRALDDLARGGAVGVFPEGTRGSGEVESVQHGIAYLALRSGAPVLPVACLGTAEALPRGAKFPKRVAVDVSYGQPFQVTMPPNPRSRSARTAAAEEIRIRMAAHLSDARALRAGRP